MDALRSIRLEIDVLDKEIISLLEKRFNITKRVGEIKKKMNISFLDKSREEEIYQKISSSIYQDEVKEIYKVIMTQSKKQQRE